MFRRARPSNAERRLRAGDDDAEAMTIAQNWSTGQPMELWEGEHKLKRWATETISPE